MFIINMHEIINNDFHNVWYKGEYDSCVQNMWRFCMFDHSAQCWDIATCAMPKLNPPPEKKDTIFSFEDILIYTDLYK